MLSSCRCSDSPLVSRNPLVLFMHSQLERPLLIMEVMSRPDLSFWLWSEFLYFPSALLNLSLEEEKKRKMRELHWNGKEKNNSSFLQTWFYFSSNIFGATCIGWNLPKLSSVSHCSFILFFRWQMQDVDLMMDDSRVTFVQLKPQGKTELLLSEKTCKLQLTLQSLRLSLIFIMAKYLVSPFESSLLSLGATSKMGWSAVFSWRLHVPQCGRPRGLSSQEILLARWDLNELNYCPTIERQLFPSAIGWEKKTLVCCQFDKKHFSVVFSSSHLLRSLQICQKWSWKWNDQKSVRCIWPIYM